MTPRTILCIDDDPRIRDTIRTIMAGASWEVWEAETGKEGLALAGKGPDVVILDVSLPDMHGFEVCRQLKAAPQTARIPVLFLSGEHVDDDARAKGLEGGGDAYLLKPVSAKVLLATVNALDRMARAERSLADALRQAEVAHAAKERFLAGMTGKLRLPLNAVMAAAGNLLDSALTPRQREQAGLVRRHADRLRTLVNNILDATRLDMDGVELEEGVFDVRAVAMEAVEMAGEQGVINVAKVSLEFSEGVPQSLRSDAGRLAQVLYHVLEQAAGRARESDIRVTVAFRPGEGETGRLAVDVAHGGGAIPAAERGRLFAPLSELAGDEELSDGVAGLGAAVSASVIALLGGEIGYREDAGGQGVFWFSLPVGGVESESVATPAARSDSGRIPKGLRVLVVDDNRVNRKVAAGVLKTMGAEVTLAEDGEQAVNLAHERAFDLVLMDLQMPVMDGFEATRRIRAAGDAATSADVPIIALTAQSDADSSALAESAGVSGYVVKPLNKAALEVAMVECVAVKQAGAGEVTRRGKIMEGAAVFSIDALLERLDGDREVMAEVLDLFLTESRRDVKRVAEAIQARAWEQAARAAHALKGAAANVGADRASAVAAALETMAKSPDRGDAASRLAALQAAFDAACAAMRKVLEKGGGYADESG